MVAASSIETVGDFTRLAAQYGPFFFAVLFILFVPFFGQKWFKSIIESKSSGEQSEREVVVEVYKTYWMSGVWFGIALAIFSVAWFCYSQIMLTRDAIETRVLKELQNRIFQGVIRGANDDDIFIHDFNNPQYKIYIYPVKNTTPMLIRYVVLFERSPPPDFGIQLLYMNRRTFEALTAAAGASQGYAPVALKFCINERATELKL